MATDIQIATLHRHWCVADAVRYHLRQSDKARMPSADKTGLPADLGLHISTFYVLSVWYSLLYVVVEGFQSLQLHDESVDQLLSQEPYISALRRFRNGTFHCQEETIPKKLLEFVAAPESERWIKKLNAALNSFFIRALNIPLPIE
jgi:hypothetical protein